MRAEAVMFQLLKANTSIAGLLGSSPSRIFQTRMAENQPYPALVLETIGANLVTPISAQAGMQLMQTRIQVNALARDVLTCKVLLDYVRQACEFQRGTFSISLGSPVVWSGSVVVQAILRDAIGADSKDDGLGVYLQSHDYLITHYET